MSLSANPRLGLVTFFRLFATLRQRWQRRPILEGMDARALRARADWQSCTCFQLMPVMRVHLTVIGKPPREGVVVANHLSYLDIILLSGAMRIVLAAKREVAHWPVFGPFARESGTLFVDREKRGDVRRVGEAMKTILEAGIPVGFFPEGTSSSGREILPFKSSLLEPIVQTGCPVAPARISYFLEDGDVVEEVHFWRDMLLAPHLLNLCSKKRIHAQIAFGPSESLNLNRKQLASHLHLAVSSLPVIDAPQ